MWVDFTYYETVFGGSLLTAENFDMHSNEAQYKIDYFTMGKANSKVDDVPFSEKIKRCVCLIAEESFKNEQLIQSNSKAMNDAINRGVASETVASHSISFNKASDYKTESELAKDYDARVNKIIYRMLAMTGLLYRGVQVV